MTRIFKLFGTQTYFEETGGGGGGVGGGRRGSPVAVEGGLDAADGRAYTRDEFVEYYREDGGLKKWDAAKPPTKGKRRRAKKKW